MTDETDISIKLQHPRRSLGNRHRTQAEKFLKLDPKNIMWAEQNAKQAILYDFTNPENWRLLIKIKILNKDSIGIRLILEDLFIILGRDKKLLEQLNKIDIIQSGEKLLDAAFRLDPLDPEEWWQRLYGNELEIEKFSNRLKLLDTRDPRSNILFSRRVEKLKNIGYEDLFLELSKYLLAQNPSNFEVWIELGKLHERRKEYEQAWFSYDQAQTHFPKSHSRDLFKKRMEQKLDGHDLIPWKRPNIDMRKQFLKKMENLSKTMVHEDGEDIPDKIGITEKVEDMIKQNRISEAFFLVRRLAAEGDPEGKLLVDKILRLMKNG